MSVAVRKPISSLTIVPAYTLKPVAYTDYRGRTVEVPVHEYIYVDVASGVALIGSDHVDIGEDEYVSLDELSF